MSPQKARLVVDLIRGKNVNEALMTLRFTNKKATSEIEKVVRSAVATDPRVTRRVRGVRGGNGGAGGVGRAGEGVGGRIALEARSARLAVYPSRDG